MRALLSADGVVRTYATPAGPVAAVRGVTLAVQQGETLGIVGESGCGKSTLGRLLLGLERPDRGAVTFDGHPAARLADPAVRRRLQAVFQDAAGALDPRMRVGPALEEPLLVHRVGDRASRAAQVRALLSAVQLPADVAERLPHQLSAGQRQRVSLARALALEPALVVLDEPVSALDVSVQAQILNLLQAIKAARSLTLVLISHDLEVVAWLADRVAVMYAGLVVELGPAAAVLEAPRHPYTRALLASRGAGEPPSPLAVPPGCAFHPRCALAVDACRRELPALLGEGHQSACPVARGAPCSG